MTSVRSQTSDPECSLSPSRPGVSAAPSDWQPRLIALLSVLEHLRANLEGRSLCTDTAQVMDHARAMVHAVEELAGETNFDSRLIAEQTDAIARAGAFLTAAETVQPTPRGGFLKSLWSGITSRATPQDTERVRDVLFAAADALNSYFALFTSQFGSSLAAREWVDAASIFLADFRRLARDLPA